MEVEQKGIDLTLRLDGPAGRLTAVDSPNGANGPEPLLLLGDEAQPLQLTIAAPDPSAPAGRYTLRVTALRPATAEDRARCAAERTFARAEVLRTAGEGALAQAVAEQQRALAAFRALGDRRREADVLDRLGRLHLRRGEMSAAQAAYRRALPLLRAFGTPQDTLAALNGLGTTARSLGQTDEALAAYREALQLLATSPDRTAAAKTWGNLGRALAEMGDAEEAFRAYDRSLAIWRELGERGEEGGTLGNVGRLYAFLGESERARETMERAAGWLEDAGSLREAGGLLTDLGMARALAGRPREGLAAAERGLHLLRRAGDRAGEAATLSTLGWLYCRAGRPAAARPSLLRAATLFKELGIATERAVALAHLGQLALLQGEPRAALALYEQSLVPLAAAGDRRREADVLFHQALAWRQAGNLAAALRSAERALARIEDLRAVPLGTDLRAAFLASRQDLYELEIDLLLDLHRRQPTAGYDARAFTTSERAKARTLLDVLSPAETAVDPALVDQERDVMRRLASAGQRQRRLEANGTPAQRAEARAAVDDLLRESERLDAEIEAAPRQAAPAPLDAREIRRRVAAPDRWILAYSLGERRSALWVIEPHRMEVFELPARRRLEDAARHAHALLATEDRTLAAPRIQRALAELSALLLGPVADRLGGQRLVILPDGALFAVPFGALPTPGRGADDSPLLERHEIVLAPSASTLVSLRRRAGPRPKGLLAVIADPVFEPDDPRLTREPAAPPHTILRAGDPSLALPRLPWSREEAEDILDLAPPDRRFAALDFAASRETVLGGGLSGYRVLHFATHAVIDPQHPALSGIALSRVDPQGRRRAGFLRAAEIRHLHLAADLVVLSACRTALGKEVRGEGFLGLTQSFFQAGAQRVLVSLWPVDDRATAKLMERFHRSLLTRGLSPAAALRAAQLSLRREPPYRSPAFWAGFVLQGDL